MSPLLSLKGLSVGYGGNTVVRNVSFDIFAGEFCALLGLNASGKTTLLKGICGLLPPVDGSCFAGELDCTGLSEKKRASYISYIPQRASKLIGVTVLDAALMGLNARLGALEFPSARDRSTVLDILEKVGVGHLADTDFSRLSEGQKQLTVLARTLAQNSPVMLMDEPDSALDFLARRRLLGLFRSLIKSESKAGLVTLHEPDLALNYCDRLLLLHDGKIVSEIRLSEASPDDIKKGLSVIYGDITVMEYCGNYVVMPNCE